MQVILVPSSDWSVVAVAPGAYARTSPCGGGLVTCRWWANRWSCTSPWRLACRGGGQRPMAGPPRPADSAHGSTRATGASGWRN